MDDPTDMTNDPTTVEGFIWLAALILETGGTRERAASLAHHRARRGAAEGRIDESVVHAAGVALTRWLQEATT